MPMNPRLLRPLASGFNPRQIAGLAAWFDAQDAASITLNGTTVSQWVDKSGSGRTLSQATPANQPDYVAAGINGKPSLELDGSNHFMNGSSTLISQPFTMYAVLEVDDNATNKNLLSGGTSGLVPVLATNGSEFLTLYAGTSISATTAVLTSPGVAVGLFDGATSVGRVNGSQVLTGNAGTIDWSPTDNGLSLGTFAGGGSQRWDGLVGEILLYAGKHTTAQTARVEGYLAWKWGLQGQLPTNHPYAYSFPGFGSQPQPSNAESVDWINAVYAAGSSVNTATAKAVDQFVSGCKSDGIWDAIKACCVLCGPDTLAGALVPLVGSAPTNNNFVAGDYNRLTGLVGDGSTTYLNTNRNNNADPQNDKHLSVYLSTRGVYGAIGTANVSGASWFFNGGIGNSTVRINNASSATIGVVPESGFVGVSRSVAANLDARQGNTTTNYVNASQAPASADIDVYRVAAGTISTSRIAFYSIGESLDLAALDARVSALITAIGAS